MFCPEGGSTAAVLAPQAIRESVRKKYAEVAVSAAGKFCYPTGRDGAEALGYEPVFIREAPESLLTSFCGVGNPFSLGDIKAGSCVLDIGCGAGFDLYVAKRLTGGQGRVCGIDLTREMVERARQGLAAAGMADIEVKQIAGSGIPYGDNMFDMVISNGVINLVPRKAELFREIFRVLTSGGKLRFADVVLEKKLPAALANSPESWSQ